MCRPITIRAWSRAGRRIIGAHGGVISPADGAGCHGVRANRLGPNLLSPTFLELGANLRLRSGRQGHRVPDGIPQMSSQLPHRWRKTDSNLWALVQQSSAIAATTRSLILRGLNRETATPRPDSAEHCIRKLLEMRTSPSSELCERAGAQKKRCQTIRLRRCFRYAHIG
jgi:hypothetical protein